MTKFNQKLSFYINLGFVFFISLLFLQSCKSVSGLTLKEQKQLKLAYVKTSVPEEGGIQFTQHTQEEESILQPRVLVDPETKILSWYAAPLLAVSPDGEGLAYLGVSNNFNNLFIKSIGGGRKKIQRTFNKNVLDMSFSHDGKHIAFTDSKISGDSDILMISADQGAALTQLAATSQVEVGPVFHPSGKSVFYTANDGSRFYIWNVIVDTGLKTQFAEGFTPVLTPDGENLLMTRNNRETGFGEIWMVSLSKGIETQILSRPDRGFSSPSISPDGKTIACVGITPKSDNLPQNLDIYTIGLNGTKLTQQTFHGGNDMSPIWAPDGKSIFFLAQRASKEGKANVWQMNIR